MEKKQIEFNNLVISSTIFYKGYFSNLYIFNYQKKKYLVKCFVDKKENNKLELLSVNDIFSREIDGLRRLNSIKSENIICPKIIHINKNELYYIQEFYEFESFDYFLSKNANFLWHNKNINSILFQFGEFLAELHNKYRINKDYCYLHGDLNNKNIGFKRNKIYIFDPSCYSFRYEHSQYYDIARVILNFYPYNLVYNSVIFDKRKLIRIFLNGYIQKSDISFSNDKLIQHLKEHINFCGKNPMSHKSTYFLKFKYMKFINHINLKKLLTIIESFSDEEI